MMRDRSSTVANVDVTWMCTPVALLPAQVAERSLAEMQPEQRLLVAILEDAIGCVLKYRDARDSHSRRIFRDAAQWVMEERGDRPFSFEHLCGVLGLDAGAVRRSLQRRLDSHDHENTTSPGRGVA